MFRIIPNVLIPKFIDNVGSCSWQGLLEQVCTAYAPPTPYIATLLDEVISRGAQAICSSNWATRILTDQL